LSVDQSSTLLYPNLSVFCAQIMN